MELTGPSSIKVINSNPSCIKVNPPTHACVQRNKYVILITMRSSSFIYNNLADTLNRYKTFAKEHK